ncbi:reverse transcriptase from transposon X-element protein, putative, partial [Rhizoctonia solani AG-3 Rhs1AP]
MTVVRDGPPARECPRPYLTAARSLKEDSKSEYQLISPEPATWRAIGSLIYDATIFTDSQAAILCIDGHSEGASRGLLRATISAIKKARKGSGGTEIRLKWCPGHAGVPGNETADEEAARVASGFPHLPHLVPQFLHDYCPATNPTTHKRILQDANRNLATDHWTLSAAGAKYAIKYPNLAPQDFLAHA